MPLRPGPSPFLDMNDLLEAVNLKAWYANNPSDGLVDSAGEIARPHPKMKAYATGVRDPAQWVEALDGREASTGAHGTAGLLLHEHARDAPEGVGVREARARVHPHPNNGSASARNAFLIMTVSSPTKPCAGATGPIGGAWARPCLECGASPCLTSAQKMVSTAVIERPGAATSCGSCILGAILWSAPRARAGRTIASGTGTAAGAIPLVDYDSSAAMAELYQGLPVVRVRDWKKVTPAYLDAVRTRVFDAVAQGGVSMSKLYVPYWLHEFTKSLDDAPAPAAAPPRQQPTCAIVVGNDPITRIQRINLRPRLPRADL